MAKTKEPLLTKSIDFTDLEGEMDKALMAYGRYAEKTAKHLNQLSWSRWARDKRKAELWLIFKEEVGDNGRYLSNDAVEHSITEDDKYQEIYEDYLEDKNKYEQSLAISTALNTRLEVLRTAMATQRVEMQAHLK